jgi:hypothetical protein
LVQKMDGGTRVGDPSLRPRNLQVREGVPAPILVLLLGSMAAAVEPSRTRESVSKAKVRARTHAQQRRPTGLERPKKGVGFRSSRTVRASLHAQPSAAEYVRHATLVGVVKTDLFSWPPCACALRQGRCIPPRPSSSKRALRAHYAHRGPPSQGGHATAVALDQPSEHRAHDVVAVMLISRITHDTFAELTAGAEPHGQHERALVYETGRMRGARVRRAHWLEHWRREYDWQFSSITATHRRPYHSPPLPAANPAWKQAAGVRERNVARSSHRMSPFSSALHQVNSKPAIDRSRASPCSILTLILEGWLIIVAGPRRERTPQKLSLGDSANGTLAGWSPPSTLDQRPHRSRECADQGSQRAVQTRYRHALSTGSSRQGPTASHQHSTRLARIAALVKRYIGKSLYTLGRSNHLGKTRFLARLYAGGIRQRRELDPEAGDLTYSPDVMDHCRRRAVRGGSSARAARDEQHV